MKIEKNVLLIEDAPIRLEENFICLTDMCHGFPAGSSLISDLLRNRKTRWNMSRLGSN